jgi:hypothetical protein
MARNPALMLKSEVTTVLRGQWKYVKGRKRYKEAYKTSIKHSREYFGGPLVEEVRAHMQKREWQQAMRGLLVLLRYYQKGFASVLRSR